MQSNKSAFGTAFKWALISAITMFVFSMITYMTKAYLNPTLGWVPYILLLLGMVMAMLEMRKEQGGFISFGEAFKTGFLFSLITAVTASVLSFIMISYIGTDMIDQIKKMTEGKLLDKGMSEDQIKMAMDISKKFMTPVWMSVWSFAGLLIAGTILALIVSAIIKKNRPFLMEPPKDDVVTNG
ncbi:MAG: DUF4199 domain-containing protein [Chitinophagales bacterium]|nr:DUF4199 domain-containing protein [Chitinophagales bacterium]